MRKILFIFSILTFTVLYISGCNPTGSYTLNITIIPDSAGTVTITPEKETYEENETITIQANANAGYKFDGWLTDLQSNLNPAKVVMNSDKDITAFFSTAPEMEVEHEGSPIDNGGIYDFPSIGGTNNTLTFTMENTGSESMYVYSIMLIGDDKDSFSVTGDSDFPTLIQPNNTQNFYVSFTPIDSQLKSVTVSISNNDPDKNPFRFGINSESSSWQSIGNKGFSQGETTHTSIVTMNDVPYIAYSDDSLSNRLIVKKYVAGSNSWETVGYSGLSVGASEYNSLATDGTNLFVAYSDAGKSNKASVKQYDETLDVWLIVGTSGFTNDAATYTNLGVDTTGTLYIAFKDADQTGQLSVMTYDGTNWVYDGGSGGISAGEINNVSMTMDGDNAYVAYSDASLSGKAVVMSNQSGSWAVLGAAGGISQSSVVNTDIYVHNGTPYIAFGDGNQAGKLTVMTYSGNWLLIGSEGFSSGSVSGTEIGVDDNGIYVIYIDSNDYYKTKSMSFNQTDTIWEPLGFGSLSGGSSNFLSMAVGTESKLYVSFRDGANSYKATVMMYE